MSSRVVAACFFVLASGAILSPVSAAELPKEFEEEVRAIAAVLEKYEKAGEHELVEKEREKIRRGFQAYAKSLESNFERSIEARKSPLLRKLEIADQELAKLEAVDAANAATLMERLAPIRKADKTGEFSFEATKEPEVHVVQISRGIALPKELGTKQERQRLGFAEVTVTVTHRPVVLVLVSQTPTRWKVDLAKGAKVHAVALSGGSDVIGLDGPLSVPISREIREDFSNFTGRPTATKQLLREYAGTPIEIGPKNPMWLASQLGPTIDEIMDQARAIREGIGQVDLSHVRFQALYFGGQPHSSRGPGYSATSFGDFTIAGPIASSLQPVKYDRLRQFVEIEGEPKQTFVLDEHQQLSIYEGDEVQDDRQAKRLPKPAMVVGRGFGAMTYDTKRKRLVFSAQTRSPNDPTKQQTALLFYDVVEGEWSEDTIPTDGMLSGLRYEPEGDLIWGLYAPSLNPMTRPRGVQRPSPGSAAQKKRLLAIDGKGKTVTDVEVKIEAKIDFSSTEIQLLRANEHVILLAPRQYREIQTGRMVAAKEQLFVIDPKSGTVLYSGSAQMQGGSNPTVNEKPSIDGEGVLAQIDKKFEAAANAVASGGSKERAELLAKQLQDCRNMMAGEIPKRTEPKLYVVGSYDQHSSTVRVTDTSGPVVLAVCSYEPASWTIEKAKGVDLKKILVGGYHKQTVKNAPKNIPLEVHCSEEGGQGFQAYSRDDDSYLRMTTTVKNLTSLDLSTFQGSYNLNGFGTITVGPSNGDWLSQQIVNALNELIAEANVENTNKALVAIRKHKFYAIHRGDFPNQKEAAPNPGRRNQPMHLNQFTIDGPLMGRGHEVQGAFQGRSESLVAFDAERQIAYGHGEGLIAINVKTGASETIPLANELPRLSWQSGLTFDPHRNRVLLTSFGGGGFLYCYDVDDAVWSVLRKPGIGNKGMVYAPDEDVIYGIDHDMGNGRIGEIKKYNPNGAMIDRIKLARPLTVERGPSGSSQFAYFPGHIAMIRSGQSDRHRFRGGQPNAPTPNDTIAVISTSTGEIVHEGTLSPIVERKELTAKQIARLWQQLIVENGSDSSLVWDLAAGHEVTVQFLGEEVIFEEEAQEVDDDDIKQRVEELNSNKYSARQAAYESLCNMGSRIVPQLETLLKGDLSAEAKQRLSNLVKSWKGGTPNSKLEKKKALAIEVLANMGTGNAKDLLRRVGAEGTPFTKALAKKKLAPPPTDASRP